MNWEFPNETAVEIEMKVKCVCLSVWLCLIEKSNDCLCIHAKDGFRRITLDDGINDEIDRKLIE